MASVFGISDLPVANPFPFLAKALKVEEEVVYVKPVKFVDDIPDKDVFVSKTRQAINEYRAKANKNFLNDTPFKFTQKQIASIQSLRNGKYLNVNLTNEILAVIDSVPFIQNPLTVVQIRKHEQIVREAMKKIGNILKEANLPLC